jgi:ADP-ribose pyrophosphatase
MFRTIIYTGRKIQVVRDTEVGADGRPVERELVLHPGAVAILPWAAPDHVCLIQNRRPVVGETLWEIPAGTLESGEDPAAAAARELAEETGFRAGWWRQLAEFYPSPGILSERMFLFIARDLSSGPAQLERDEQIEPHIVPWSQALAWAMDGTVRDAKTLTALLLWDRLRGIEKQV